MKSDRRILLGYHWSGDPFEAVEIIFHTILINVQSCLCVSPRVRIWSSKDEYWSNKAYLPDWLLDKRSIITPNPWLYDFEKLDHRYDPLAPDE